MATSLAVTSISLSTIATLANNAEFVAQLKAGKKSTSAKDWIYADYDMTVFSNSEEDAATKGYLQGGEMLFFPENALDIAGGNYHRSQQDWASKVVVDRELISG